MNSISDFVNFSFSVMSSFQSSVSTSPLLFSSGPADSAPATLTPQSLNGRSSHLLASSSVSQSPKEELSFNTISFIFSTVRPSNTWHGTSFHPRRFNASRRMFPPMATYFLPIGTTITGLASRSSGVSSMERQRTSTSSDVHSRGFLGKPSICPVFCCTEDVFIIRVFMGANIRIYFLLNIILI